MFRAMAIEKNISSLCQKKNSLGVLVLSTGYEPMFKTNWKRALTAVYGGRAEVVETHDDYTISTINGCIPFPTIVRFTTGIFVGKLKKIKVEPKLTKRNVWLRDNGKCQYCDCKLSLDTSTVDHVIPKSKGGPHVWDNVVLSCCFCNQKKGSSLLNNSSMQLRSEPKKPSLSQVVFIK